MKSQRVLFIHAGRIGRREGDAAFKEKLPHIGLLYVAAAARRAGHTCAIIDAYAEGMPPAELLRRARDFGPDVLAFTANTSQIVHTAALAEALRGEFPTSPFVLGGYHVSPIPVETLEEFPVFDCAVFGEADESFVELLANIEDPAGCAAIPGVAAHTRNGVLRGPDRAQVVDLDDLPFPAYDLTDYRRYRALYERRPYRSLLLSTGRGCPYHCNFCQNPGGTQVRVRSIESVVDEIEYDIERYGTRRIFITDETFTLNRKRTIALLEEMLRRGTPKRVQWLCETRADAVDEELMKLMRRAGCYAIFYGLESGSQELLGEMDKRTRLEHGVQAVRWARESGIFTHVNFIFGHANETRETVMETIRYAVRANADVAGFTLMVPYPGTEIHRMATAGEGHLRLRSTDWKDYRKLGDPVLELDNLPAASLRRLQLYAYVRYYSRPQKMLQLPRVGRVSIIPWVLADLARDQLRSLWSDAATKWR